MSTAPTPYERQANFTSYEQSNPTSPKSGASLDAELNAIRTSLNAALNRLLEIQRDDGGLGNQVVTPDSLSDGTIAMMGGVWVPRGDWATTTVYSVDDMVRRSNVNYLCLEAHVAGTFATDLAAAKWQPLCSTVAPLFTASYTSPDQTITAGGALTLTHSLGAAPQLVQVRLKCATSELGYAIDDEIIINPNVATDASNRGVSVVVGTTALTVRFGSAAASFGIIRKDTGAIANIVNANWVAIFKAWA